MSRVLVTGASGFVGQGLLPVLQAAGHEVAAVARRVPRDATAAIRWHACDLADPAADLKAVLAGIDSVVHLAGVAHVAAADNAADAERYRAVNCRASTRLMAAADGARRFIYVSSATVHGPSSGAVPFSEESLHAPVGPYARSKTKAERELRVIAAARAIELVIVRPPLVYGPRVKGNFLRLLHWAAGGRPFPATSAGNPRRMIGLTNLCRFLELAGTHPAAAGQSFLVADAEELSIGELYCRLARLCGRKPRLLKLPTPVAAALRRLMPGTLDRLFADFRIDANKASRLLGWRPPIALDDELRRTVDWYRAYDRCVD